MSEGLPISESLILACVGALAGMCGAFLTCILRSRCVKIKCCGIECERQLPNTQPEAIDVRAVTVNRNN
jgi:hypothetical protein